MSGFFFSKAAVSSSKNWRSASALLGGMQLTVMRVLPSAASSPSEPQAVSARAPTPSAGRVRRIPVLLIGGPLAGQERVNPSEQER
ncbi:hypothetical protein STREPTOSP366_57490 [Streptomyces variabilis]